MCLPSGGIVWRTRVSRGLLYGSLLEVSLATGDQLHLERPFNASFFEFTFNYTVFDATVELNSFTFIRHDDVGGVALDHARNARVVGSLEVKNTA